MMKQKKSCVKVISKENKQLVKTLIMKSKKKKKYVKVIIKESKQFVKILLIKQKRNCINVRKES